MIVDGYNKFNIRIIVHKYKFKQPDGPFEYKHKCAVCYSYFMIKSYVKYPIKLTV